MAHRLLPVCATVTLGLWLALPQTAAAQMYRYTDANGQVVIGNTIPQEATRRGYDILGSNGRVVKTIPPEPTKEELAEREARKAQEAEQARQREADEQLLKRYSHPDQAVKAMQRKIGEMQGLIQLKRGNISVVSSQLDAEQSKAADMERSGQAIPEATLQKIDRLGSQIRDMEREIASQEKEIEALKQDYLEDIRRLEAITGERHTLSLETPEAP
ncbi:DUF4124 domain-containing protein [Marinobacter sp. C2H3]|uniref:DUF4124 domain-containing protein n=1 Tax=Marinobacter sp. C2H3 TaxID=3119003 RepID=UPI00300EB01B